MNTNSIVGYNYLGPYVSGGKFQESVADSDVVPVDKLDANARVHDRAYNRYKDYGHRVAADMLFSENAGDSSIDKIASNAVTYGNQVGRSASNVFGGLLGKTPLFALANATYGAVKNQYELYDYISNQEQYRKDIEKLYDEDTFWKTFGGGGVKEMNESAAAITSAGGDNLYAPRDYNLRHRRVIPVTESKNIESKNVSDRCVTSDSCNFKPTLKPLSENLLYFGDVSAIKAWKQHRARLFDIRSKKVGKKKKKKGKYKVIPTQN